MNRVVLTAAVLAPLLACLPARAEDVPAHFVPEEMCASRDCTCDDLPMMEAFQANQIAARDAWMTVKTDILTPTGPSSGAQAIALFKKRFPGDPRIIAQFKTCSGYDPTKNDASKVAGVSPLGKATVDPCFCNAFCKDIVDSTIAHERMHVPTIVAGVVGSGDMLVACKIGVVSGRVCDAIEPMTLAQSELASYGAGIAYLDATLRVLQQSDPMMPDVACTWEPLAQQSQEPQQARAAPLPAPAGFFARVELLLRRIFGGESPAEAKGLASEQVDRIPARRRSAVASAPGEKPQEYSMYFEDFSRTQAANAPAHAAETSDLFGREPLAAFDGARR